jgi:hypothetical protein
MAAGDPIPWSYIATRVSTTEITANSATYGATETTLYTISPTLVSGLVYRVCVMAKIAVDVAADVSFLRIREDTLTGNQIDGANLYGGTTNTSGYPVLACSEYTATSTGAKTFVITGQRVTGTGTAHGVKASSNRKSYITVDLIVS